MTATPDLYVVNSSGMNILYRNQGNGTFTGVADVQTAVGNAWMSSGDVVLLSTTKSWFFRGSGTTENFMRIGHSLLALVLAFVGGPLSRWMYDRKDLGIQVSGNRP